MRTIEVRLTANPPGKANQYRIVYLPDARHPRGGYHRLATTVAVQSFEEAVCLLFQQQAARLSWPRLDGPAALDIWWYVPNRRRRDADNIVKSIADAITRAGIWRDDSLVYSQRVEKRISTTVEPHLHIVVGELPLESVYAPEPIAPWSPAFTHPSPETRRQWAELMRTDRALGLVTEPVLKTWCRLCAIGIGQDCHETEVWCLPVHNRRGHLTSLQIVCRFCADELRLPTAYRLLTTEQVAEPSLTETDILLLVLEKRKEMLAHGVRPRPPERSTPPAPAHAGGRADR